MVDPFGYYLVGWLVSISTAAAWLAATYQCWIQTRFYTLTHTYTHTLALIQNDSKVSFEDTVEFDNTGGIEFYGDNDISGDTVEFHNRVQFNGPVQTYNNVEFNTDSKDYIDFKGHGAVNFRDNLHVTSRDHVGWRFDGHDNVEVRFCGCE